MVAPWILKLLGLAVLFYGGIYLNVKFAMKSEIPPYINMFIFAFLVVLVLTQIFIYHVRFGKYNYKFYTNRIDFEGKKPKTFIYSDFQEAVVKQGLFDRMFGTGIIELSSSFRVGPVAGVAQVKSYIEQLVRYYRYTQDKFRAQQQQASMQQQMAQQPQQQAAPQQQAQQQPSQQPAPAAQPQQQPQGQPQVNNTGM